MNLIVALLVLGVTMTLFILLCALMVYRAPNQDKQAIYHRHWRPDTETQVDVPVVVPPSQTLEKRITRKLAERRAESEKKK